jgi:hypothetical protein
MFIPSYGCGITPRKNHIAGITSTTRRNMSTSRHRVLALLVASICLVGIYFIVPEPEVSSDSGSILLRAGVSADPGTSVEVAKYELQRGEVLEYSFEASGIVKFIVLSADIGPYPSPLVTWLKVTSMSASGNFTSGSHSFFWFLFKNPSETSDVELTYTVGHHFPAPTALGLFVMFLAVATGASGVIHLILFRRWQRDGVSSEQRYINDLWERRRSDSKSLWLRH